MVDDEIMVRFTIVYRVVEIPLYRERKLRINNKYSQSFLRRIDSANNRSRYGTGMSAGCFLILYIHRY